MTDFGLIADFSAVIDFFCLKFADVAKSGDIRALN